MLKRFGLTLASLIVLMLLAFLFTYDLSGRDRFWGWLVICGGPIQDISWRTSPIFPLILVGWLGPPLMVSHLIKPTCLTAILTVVGFLLWLFAGVLTFSNAYYGG
jgi:hypothetical protein